MSGSQLDSDIGPCPECAGGAGAVGEIVARYGSEPDMLIPMMQDIQTAHGYLARSELLALARALEVPLSRVYSVATFYSSFRLEPPGEHSIALCMGTVCYLKGADRIATDIQEEFQVAPGGTSPDGKFSFAPVNCLGACALAPVMVVDGEYFGGLTRAAALDLLHKIATGERPAGAAVASGNGRTP